MINVKYFTDKPLNSIGIIITKGENEYRIKWLKYTGSKYWKDIDCTYERNRLKKISKDEAMIEMI